MIRVAVTGLGLLSAAGAGTDPFRAALAEGAPLGGEEEIPLPHGGPRRVRVARLHDFDPQSFLSPKQIRRMSREAQVVTAAFLLARDASRAASRPCPPERCGTFLGSGFGSITTSAEYLRGMFVDGMSAASPFLFSESLACSPLGHAAIVLDARGPSMALAGGDCSMIAALAAGWRAVREGRIRRAVVCGFEEMGEALLSVLARAALREEDEPAFGEGAAAMVLEDLGWAVSTGAEPLAELSWVSQAGDPFAPLAAWSADPDSWLAAYGPAVAGARDGAPRSGIAIRHAPPSRAAARAEAEAIARLAGEWKEPSHPPVHAIFGAYAAAGGFTAAAALQACASAGEPALVSGGSWGGATGAALMEPPAA